ncbi:glycosyltransferase family 9 protein [Actinophytocola sp.]|uniref:glycosyltransferase family 9 protein n=1 Tax=Actinophytocola sp. TaxID=1872138 RepID=UPI00389B0F58
MLVDVLVLRALKIGDLLVAVPALRGLRRAFPRDRIVLAAPEGLAQLVALTGAVDELLPTPGLGALRYPGTPGVAVNLHGAGPESVADLLDTRPARLVTHRHPAFPEVAGPPWHEETHEVRRWCDLLTWHGIPADPSELRLALPELPSVAPDAVVVHPGASVESRRWPAERFAEVAGTLAAAGRHVVVTGSTGEIALAETVARQADLPDDAVLAGHLDLTGLAALVAAAALVVSNDTGVGHLATAYDTPSVVLFGPTPPDRWGPPADRPRHRALWAGTDGLRRLSTKDVLAAAEAVERA